MDDDDFAELYGSAVVEPASTVKPYNAANGESPLDGASVLVPSEYLLLLLGVGLTSACSPMLLLCRRLWTRVPGRTTAG